MGQGTLPGMRLRSGGESRQGHEHQQEPQEFHGVPPGLVPGGAGSPRRGSPHPPPAVPPPPHTPRQTKTRKMGITTDATVTVNPHESFRVHDNRSIWIIQPMNAAANAVTTTGMTRHSRSMFHLSAMGRPAPTPGTRPE